MGCLYRRDKDCWIKHYRNGKPFNESSHSEKKEVAKRLLKQREGEISKGEVPGIYFDKVSFAELAEDLNTDYRINAKKSQWRIGIAIKHLSDYFGNMKATAITTPKVGGIPYIPILREPNVRKGFFEHKEFLAVRDALPFPINSLVTFAYRTGWRKGEILGLTWDRVEL